MLVMVNHFIKMAHFSCYTKTILGQETMDLFSKNAVRLHGLPDDVPSYHESQFISHFWRCHLRTFDTLVNLFLAYHQQTDVQTIHSVLCQLPYQQGDWFDLVPMAKFA